MRCVRESVARGAVDGQTRHIPGAITAIMKYVRPYIFAYKTHVYLAVYYDNVSLICRWFGYVFICNQTKLT